MATYYWLKLKENFFKEKEIKKLRKIAGGDTYTIIYLKMQLLSLKNGGQLFFDGIEESFADELALELDEEPDNVKVTLLYLQKHGLIEARNDHEYTLPQAIESFGKDDPSKYRVRKYREKLKSIEEKIKTHPLGIEHIDHYENEKLYNGNYYIVMNRDKCKCVSCGTFHDLVVHKLIPHDDERLANAKSNLVTLCKKCRDEEVEHPRSKISPKILHAIGFNVSSLSVINQPIGGDDYVTCNDLSVTCNTMKQKCSTELELELRNKNIMCGKPHDTDFFSELGIKEPSFEETSYDEDFNFDDFSTIDNKRILKTNRKLLDVAARVVLRHFNWRSQSRYRPVESNLSMIRTILSSGVTIRDCYAVNSAKCVEWQNDPEMSRFLRPKTLYTAKNFEQYLGKIQSNRAKQIKEAANGMS